jgi:hypothetical protein
MTQRRTPAGSGAGTGTGSEQTGGASTTLNGPVALVFDEIPGVINGMGDGHVWYDIIDGNLFSGTVERASSDFVWQFTAADNGRIEGIMYANGAVAMDGSVGWELAFINDTNSDASLAYFGFGSGTEAAKGTDNDVAVAAGAIVYVSNSLTATTARFNRGDLCEVTADRDGTTSVGSFRLLVSYESEGYTA